MRVLISGDSHTAALKLGLDQLLQNGMDAMQGCQIDIKPLGRGASLSQPFFKDQGSYAEITKETNARQAKRLPMPAEDGGQYDFYALCGPLNTIRTWRTKEYWADFAPSCSGESGRPVSSGLLRHVVIEEQKYLMALVDLLIRVGCKVLVIETPKPYRHNPAVILKPKIVRYVDHFYRETMKGWLATKNVPIIAIPDDCFDPDGFMQERFRHPNHEDSHHANAEFGEVMLQQTIRHVLNADTNRHSGSETHQNVMQ